MLVLLVIIVTVVVCVRMMKKADEDIQEEERKKSNELQETAMQKLVHEYVNSDLVREILNVICDGNYYSNFPKSIHVDLYGVLGNGNSYTFSEHRVADMSWWRDVTNEDGTVKSQIYPCVALAEAFNYILGNNYDVKVDSDDLDVWMERKPTRFL